MPILKVKDKLSPESQIVEIKKNLKAIITHLTLDQLYILEATASALANPVLKGSSAVLKLKGLIIDDMHSVFIKEIFRPARPKTKPKQKSKS